MCLIKKLPILLGLIVVLLLIVGFVIFPLSDSDENKRLSSSKGMLSYRLIAVYQNKAYVIVAPPQYEDTINKMLATVFSFQLS